MMKRFKPTWAQLSAPAFSAYLNETLQTMPTGQLLTALRRTATDKACWQGWRVRQLHLIRLNGLPGFQFHATGCIGQPWFQVLYDAHRHQCYCRVGRLHRLRFQMLSESRGLALAQLASACQAWAILPDSATREGES